MLRRMLNSGKIIMAPGAFNALTAKIIENVGFEAVYVTGAGTSCSLLGMPDVGLITMSEMEMNARYISNAVDIPVICDADTGYGNAVNVMRTVKAFEKAGVAAIHIEDQVAPKRCGHLSGKILISIEEMVKKIKAAVKAREDKDFVIIARTDARGSMDGGVDEVVKRGKAYASAGADVIFPEAPMSIEEMKLFAEEIPAPLMANMVMGGVTPNMTAQELEKAGYSIVIFPMAALQVSVKAVTDLMEALKNEGTDKRFEDKMLPLKEIFDLVGLERIRSFERKYLPARGISARYKGLGL